MSRAELKGNVSNDQGSHRGGGQREKDCFDRFKMALDPADIARSIVFALDQPADVQIAEMMILPVNRY